jgi:hypothetical protein
MNLKRQTVAAVVLVRRWKRPTLQMCSERIEKNVGEAFVVLDYLSKQESGCTRGGKPGKCLPYPN